MSQTKHRRTAKTSENAFDSTKCSALVSTDVSCFIAVIEPSTRSSAPLQANLPVIRSAPLTLLAFSSSPDLIELAKEHIRKHYPHISGFNVHLIEESRRWLPLRTRADIDDELTQSPDSTEWVLQGNLDEFKTLVAKNSKVNFSVAVET